MSFYEKSGDTKKVKSVARNGQLKDIIELSAKFSDNVNLMSEALVEACFGNHLNVVKWLVEHTAADVNCTAGIVVRTVFQEDSVFSYTPLTVACRHGHLNIVKYLVEVCRADINLPD